VRGIVAAVAALLLAQPAHAAPDLRALHGVWAGTIGNLAVHACYDAGKYRDEGKYFYDRRLGTIPLKAEEKVPGGLAEGWTDDSKIARWRMRSVGKDQAEGTWTRNGRSLPIRLKRVAFERDADFDTPCGSLAFVQPIVDATRIDKSAARIRGLAAVRWTLAYPDDSISVDSFQLVGTGPAIAAINFRLREPFDKADEGWKWCLRNAGAFGADYHDTVEARLVTTSWLSVRFTSDSFCGGAHPNTASLPVLFNRRNGMEVDLYTWIFPAFSDRQAVPGYSGSIDKPKGKLLALVLKLHPRAGDKDDDCGEAVADASSWALELKETGIGFTPDLPRVVMACGDEVVVPWARLDPFLDPTGKREIAALRAQLGR
jgi:hypothetical protein